MNSPNSAALSYPIFAIMILGPLLGEQTRAQETQPWKQAEGELVRQIDAAIKERVDDGFAGVILIRHKGRDLIHRAYGFRDREKKTKLTVEHGFTIGSIVKPITAAAIFKLQEQGKLSTADQLKKYFPDAPEDKLEITIDQLLRHQSGMPDIFGDDFDVVDRKWFLEKALNCKLLFEPGAKRRYSNAGYSLLAVIIEKVSGQPYEKYVSSQIIRPAGKLQIGYLTPQWKNENLAVGYHRDGKRWGTLLDHPWADDGPSWNLRGNGGMLSNARDLCLWYEAMIDGKILGEEARQKYFDVVGQKSRRTGKIVLGHAGGNGIFNSLQVSFLGADLHLTFFTSVAGQNAERVIEDFRDAFFDLAEKSAAADD